MSLQGKCPHWEQYNTPLNHADRCDLCNFDLPHHMGPLYVGIFHGLSLSKVLFIHGPGKIPPESMRPEAVDDQNCPHLKHASMRPLRKTSCFDILALATLWVICGCFDTSTSPICWLSCGCLPRLGKSMMAWITRSWNHLALPSMLRTLFASPVGHSMTAWPAC